MTWKQKYGREVREIAGAVIITGAVLFVQAGALQAKR